MNKKKRKFIRFSPEEDTIAYFFGYLAILKSAYIWKEKIDKDVVKVGFKYLE